MNKITNVDTDMYYYIDLLDDVTERILPHLPGARVGSGRVGGSSHYIVKFLGVVTEWLWEVI